MKFANFGQNSELSQAKSRTACYFRYSRSNNGGNARSRGCEYAGYLELGNFQEAPQYVRIELRAAAGIETANRFHVVESLSVAAVGNHSVKGVDDRYDARTQRDLLSLQTTWVSGALEGFVMMESEQAGLFQSGKQPQDRPAVLRMFVHDGTLFVGEPARLL